MTNKVVILGSTNVDQFLTVERYAQPGETLHVEEAQKAFGGGKGANQAIATARMQADTTFITKIGTDGVADFILEDFKAAHIDTSYIIKQLRQNGPSLYHCECRRTKHHLCLWWCEYDDDT